MNAAPTCESQNFTTHILSQHLFLSKDTQGNMFLNGL